MARSEAYLSELLEAVCSSMSDYALHVDITHWDDRVKQEVETLIKEKGWWRKVQPVAGVLRTPCSSQV